MKPLPFVWPYALLFWPVFLWDTRLNPPSCSGHGGIKPYRTPSPCRSFSVDSRLHSSPRVHSRGFRHYSLPLCTSCRGVLCRRRGARAGVFFAGTAGECSAPSFTVDAGRTQTRRSLAGAYRVLRHPLYTASISSSRARIRPGGVRGSARPIIPGSIPRTCIGWLWRSARCWPSSASPIASS